MMWYWGAGYGWGMAIFGALMMLLFWGGIAAAIVVLIRSLSGSRLAPNDNAMETLRRRLAAGEITSEEFEQIRKILQG
jgi:putative membrane protein